MTSYGTWLLKAEKSPTKLGRYGRVAGLTGLVMAPTAAGIYGGYKAGTGLYDKAASR